MAAEGEVTQCSDGPGVPCAGAGHQRSRSAMLPAASRGRPGGRRRRSRVSGQSRARQQDRPPRAHRVPPVRARLADDPGHGAGQDRGPGRGRPDGRRLVPARGGLWLIGRRRRLQSAGAGALVPYRDPAPAFSTNHLVTRDFSSSPYQTEPNIAIDPDRPRAHRAGHHRLQLPLDVVVRHLSTAASPGTARSSRRTCWTTCSRAATRRWPSTRPGSCT